MLERPVPEELLTLDVRRDLSRAYRRELMARAAARWEGAQRGLIECSETILDLDDHGPRVALRRLERVEVAYGDDPGVRFCVDFLRPIYRELGWRPFAEEGLRRLWRMAARRAGRARPTFAGT